MSDKVFVIADVFFVREDAIPSIMLQENGTVRIFGVEHIQTIFNRAQGFDVHVTFVAKSQGYRDLTTADSIFRFAGERYLDHLAKSLARQAQDRSDDKAAQLEYLLSEAVSRAISEHLIIPLDNSMLTHARRVILQEVKFRLGIQRAGEAQS